jgi:hypothetical protein
MLDNLVLVKVFVAAFGAVVADLEEEVDSQGPSGAFLRGLSERWRVMLGSM